MSTTLKSLIFWLALVVAALAIYQFATSRSGEEAPPAALVLSVGDLAAIRDVDARLTGAVLRSDWPAVQALFAGNAVLMPPGAGTIAGAAAIAEWYASASGTLHELTTNIEAIGGSGNLAVMRGTYRLVITPLGATAPVTETGKSLRVLQRQADRSWRITSSIWNSQPD